MAHEVNGVPVYTLGDVGTAIAVQFLDQDGVAIDVSAATTQRLDVKKRSGAVVQLVTDFEDDGVDGWVVYQWAEGDFDETGKWTIAPYAVVGIREFHGRPFEIWVKNIFEL